MENTIILKTNVAKTDMGYEGSVTCFRGSEKLWTDYADITRLTREDAMNDAVILRDDIAAYNCLVKQKGLNQWNF